MDCGGDTTLWNESDPPRCLFCEKTYSNAGGIVALTEAADDRDYPAALVDLIASVERRHFWFTARNDAILWTLRRVMGTLTGLRVLDIGCGTGFVTEALERAGMDAWGIDMVRIGGCGGSAGGFTVLWLAFAPDMADPKSADAVARESTRLRCVLASRPAS